MKKTFDFEFTDEQVGTICTVTTRRLFGENATHKYRCYGRDYYNGTLVWYPLEGAPLTADLQHEINVEAALAAMKEYGKRLKEFIKEGV